MKDKVVLPTCDVQESAMQPLGGDMRVGFQVLQWRLQAKIADG